MIAPREKCGWGSLRPNNGTPAVGKDSFFPAPLRRTPIFQTSHRHGGQLYTVQRRLSDAVERDQPVGKRRPQAREIRGLQSNSCNPHASGEPDQRCETTPCVGPVKQTAGTRRLRVDRAGNSAPGLPLTRRSRVPSPPLEGELTASLQALRAVELSAHSTPA